MNALPAREAKVKLALGGLGQYRSRPLRPRPLQALGQERGDFVKAIIRPGVRNIVNVCSAHRSPFVSRQTIR